MHRNILLCVSCERALASSRRVCGGRGSSPEVPQFLLLHTYLLRPDLSLKEKVKVLLAYSASEPLGSITFLFQGWAYKCHHHARLL